VKNRSLRLVFWSRMHMVGSFGLMRVLSGWTRVLVLVLRKRAEDESAYECSCALVSLERGSDGPLRACSSFFRPGALHPPSFKLMVRSLLDTGTASRVLDLAGSSLLIRLRSGRWIEPSLGFKRNPV
jgi:hypothetical protein